MKKIGILGAGTIGCLIGGCLSESGQDVIIFEPSWFEQAEVLKNRGLLIDYLGSVRKVKVKVLFGDEISKYNEKLDILFVTVRSNDTARLLKMMKPLMADNAWVVSPQNGINEDTMIPIVGIERIVPCISYTGGRVPEPGHVIGHGGYFVVGEIDGRITPRVQELSSILGVVNRTVVSENVMRERWSKLSQVVMTVPIGCILGKGMGIFSFDRAHTVFARMMCETMNIARAAGYQFDQVMGVTTEGWQRLAQGPVPELSRIIADSFELPPGEPPVDSITIAIKNGRPLEVEYTNAYVINKGKELGVPTVINELILNMVLGIQSGQIIPGEENLERLMKLTETCNP